MSSTAVARLRPHPVSAAFELVATLPAVPLRPCAAGVSSTPTATGACEVTHVAASPERSRGTDNPAAAPPRHHTVPTSPQPVDEVRFPPSSTPTTAVAGEVVILPAVPSGAAA